MADISAVTIIKVRIELVLDAQEAQWLKGLVQNPPSPEEAKNPICREVCAKLFNAINGVIPS